MARYFFGERLEQVGVEVGADLSLKLKPNDFLPPLYDKPVTDGTRVVVTDFLIASVAATTIPTDDTGIPVLFEGPDNLTSLYDEAGHRLKANDADSSGAPDATETVKGISRVSTDAEADAGLDNTTQMTPVKVERRIDAHDTSSTSHQEIRDTADQALAATTTKADLVAGKVPLAQIPASTGATPDTVVLREAVTGTIQVGQSTADNHAMQRVEILAAIADGAGSGADVRDLVATGLPLAATGTGTWVTIPGMAVTDAASGQKWKASLQLVVRSTATAGVKVRSKIGTAALTSLLPNGSAEVDTTGWTVNSTHTLARDTVAGGQDGTANFKITCNSTTTVFFRSSRFTAAPGDVFTLGAYVKLGAGAAKNFRADVEFEDAAGAPITGGTQLGSVVVPSGSFVRSTKTSSTVAPAGTATVRVRCVYVTPAIGDIIHVDAINLEPFAPLPAYGNTGASGANALDIRGYWRGLTLTAPTTENYSRVTPIRYASGAGNLETLHGALGASTDSIIVAEFEDITVTGSGLTGQRIEFEVADNASDGANHASIVAASGTFARVL